MKTTLQLLLLFCTSVSFSQITLEHTYTDGFVNRVKLEYSGEKYYVFKSTTNELVFYNADYSFWKTISLIVPEGNYGIIDVIHISETVINPDNNIEIIYYYLDSKTGGLGTNAFGYGIMSENGNLLLKSDYYNPIKLSKIEGLQNKIIVGNKLYSLPGLVLQYEFPSYAFRVKLEYSGEKYYFVDDVNKHVVLYNSDFTFWKTIRMTKPLNYDYPSCEYDEYGNSPVKVVFERQNSTHDLLVGYSSYIKTDKCKFTTILLQLVNENGEVLLSNIGSYEINHVDGLEDKLLNRSFFGTNIYSSSSLSLEHHYDHRYSNQGSVSRVKLTSSGEKYYQNDGAVYLADRGIAILKIYNSNHTLWKSIELPLPHNYELKYINFVSDKKINEDDLIEISYTYVYYNYTAGVYLCESKIINELGNEIITIPAVARMHFSEELGLEKKIIADFVENYKYFNSIWNGGNVYSLGVLNNDSFQTKPMSLVAPNPANTFVNITGSVSFIVEASIYNMIGALVKQVQSPNISKIDVGELQNGMYILNLKDIDNIKSTHKIIISH